MKPCKFCGFALENSATACSRCDRGQSENMVKQDVKVNDAIEKVPRPLSAFFLGMSVFDFAIYLATPMLCGAVIGYSASGVLGAIGGAIVAPILMLGVWMLQ